MSEVAAFLLGLLPSVIAGAVAFYIQRAQKKRDERLENSAKARKDEALLSLDLIMASAKLSYASAMAIKRGYANGEVEEAIKNYEDVNKKYIEFLKEQTSEHITK